MLAAIEVALTHITLERLLPSPLWGMRWVAACDSGAHNGLGLNTSLADTMRG